MTGFSERTAILRPMEMKAADRGGYAVTVPLVQPSVGSRTMLNGITTIHPGQSIPLHSHNCEESVIVLDGNAIADIDGKDYELGPLDTTWIAPDVPHRFRNPSASASLRIFWTYASIDATRTLLDTGETRRVSTEHAKPATTKI